MRKSIYLPDATREEVLLIEPLITDTENKHLWLDYDAQRVAISFEIRDQHFDVGAGSIANGAHRLRDLRRAAVRHVVAIDHRDHRVSHSHPRNRLGHAARLVGISGQRFSFCHRAKGAAPRADFA